MNPGVSNLVQTPIAVARTLFWRTAAGLAGVAVERKQVLRRALAWAPALLAGGLAFALGRVVGQIVRGLL